MKSSMKQTAFPIDGCGPLEADEASRYDGQWLLVSPEFVPLAEDEHPKLEQVAVQLRLGYLVLTAPGMLRLDIVPDVIEDDESIWREAHDADGSAFTVVDEGDLAAEWFSNFLDAPCRLVKRLDKAARA